MEYAEKRVEALDGLRGAAAILVVLAHYAAITGSYGGLFRLAGEAGVMVFFSLSGFLMGTLYLRRQWRRDEVASYAVRRIGRVVPLYWASISVALVLFLVTGSSWPFTPITLETLPRNALFWKGTGILWTVPVEMQFYLLFIGIWLLASRWGGSAALAFLLVTCSVIAWLGYPSIPPLLGDSLFAFTGGLVVSIVPLRRSLLVEVLFVVLVVLLFATIPDIQKAIGLHYTPPQHNVALFLAAPLLVLTTAHSKLASSVLSTAPARFLGAVSYGLYLLHLVVWNLAEPIMAGWPAPLQHLTATALSLLAAWASFRFFETPVRLWLIGLAGRPRLLATRPA